VNLVKEALDRGIGLSCDEEITSIVFSFLFLIIDTLNI